MKCSSPILAASFIAIAFGKHLFTMEKSPINGHDNKIHNNGQCIKKMKCSLQLDGSAKSLISSRMPVKRILAKIKSIVTCPNRQNKSGGGQHQGPVCKWHSEVSHIGKADSSDVRRTYEK